MRFLNLIVTFVLLFFISWSSFAQADEGMSVRTENADISKSITLYPNPSTDFVHIKLGVLKSGQVKLSLHNILGSEITIDSEITEDHEIKVRVKDLPTGYYLLAVRDEKTNFRGTYKFLKR